MLARGLWRLAQDKNARVNKKLVTVFDEVWEGGRCQSDPKYTMCGSAHTFRAQERKDSGRFALHGLVYKSVSVLVGQSTDLN